MKTSRILTILTSAFLFAASTPCFALTLAKDLSSAEAKAMGIEIKAEHYMGDLLRVTLKLKKDGELKRFMQAELHAQDGRKVIFEGSLKEDSFSAEPGHVHVDFNMDLALLAKASLHLVINNSGGPGQPVELFDYVINLAEYIPAQFRPEVEKPTAEDLALVKGFILKGTVKQSMGSFNGEGNYLDPGATFEMDLSNLPKEKIQFTLPEGRSGFAGYIHFDAPIEIVKVKKKSGKDRVGIYLSANDSNGELRIQIVADLPPAEGNWCHVSFYREGSGGFISSSMAEASGELKVKAAVPSDLPPEDAKVKSPIRSPEMAPASSPLSLTKPEEP